MSKCSFDLTFSEEAAAVVQKFQNRITGAGGTFTGNEGNGVFTVKTPVGAVEGNYTVAGSVITINIVDKPMFLGCGMIEEFIRKELQ
jgi:hypothetical protein